MHVSRPVRRGDPDVGSAGRELSVTAGRGVRRREVQEQVLDLVGR